MKKLFFFVTQQFFQLKLTSKYSGNGWVASNFHYYFELLKNHANNLHICWVIKIFSKFFLFFFYIYTFIPNPPYPNIIINFEKKILLLELNFFLNANSAKMQIICMIFKQLKKVVENWSHPERVKYARRNLAQRHFYTRGLFCTTNQFSTRGHFCAWVKKYI